jgi:hypothetical protein
MRPSRRWELASWTSRGSILAEGKRGCGIKNDSGCGGAGGSILIVGYSVSIAETAIVSAAGGLAQHAALILPVECTLLRPDRRHLRRLWGRGRVAAL